jgi:hypothetical protein
MGILDRILEALMRRAAKQQGVPPGQLLSSTHSREVLFPDERLRDESSLRASFDPFNFRIALKKPATSRAVHDLVMAGNIKEAKRQTHDVLLTMPASRQRSYLLEITSGLHEMRHFHDSFGTLCGIARQLQVVRDAIAFNQLLDALKQHGRLKLPLLVWANQPDAPDALKRYVSTRRTFIEWLNVIDGTLPPQTFSGHTKEADALILVSLTGLQAQVPAVPLNRARMPANVDFNVVTPLGARAIMEGNAFALQMAIVSTLFGAPAMSLFKSIGTEASATGEPYMVVDLYLSKKFGQGTPWQPGILRCVSDLAMMGTSVEKENRDYPGMRLVKAAGAAKAHGDLKKPVATEPYMNDIAERCGWASPSRVTLDAIHETETLLASLPKENTIWPNILRAIYATHLEFLNLRKEHPGILADLDTYIEHLPELPPPPILESDDHIEARGLTQADAEAFALWFLFEHIERQLLFSTRLPCPISENGLHSCGGDVLNKKTWRYDDSCQFSRLVKSLGLPELQVSVAG